MKGWLLALGIALVLLVAGPMPVKLVALVAVIEGVGLAIIEWGWRR